MATNNIHSAYKASKHIYDDVMTQGSPLTRVYNRVFWDGVDDRDVAREVLACIPEDFDGAPTGW